MKLLARLRRNRALRHARRCAEGLPDDVTLSVFDGRELVDVKGSLEVLPEAFAQAVVADPVPADPDAD